MIGRILSLSGPAGFSIRTHQISVYRNDKGQKKGLKIGINGQD